MRALTWGDAATCSVPHLMHYAAPFSDQAGAGSEARRRWPRRPAVVALGIREMGEALEGGLAQAALDPLRDVVGDRPQEQVAARPLG